MIMICLSVVLVKKFQSPSKVVLASTWDTWDNSIIQSCSRMRLTGLVASEKLTDSKTPKRRVVVITLAASSQTRERTARTEVIRIAWMLEVCRWCPHCCAFQEIYWMERWLWIMLGLMTKTNTNLWSENNLKKLESVKQGACRSDPHQQSICQACYHIPELWDVVVITSVWSYFTRQRSWFEGQYWAQTAQ